MKFQCSIRFPEILPIRNISYLLPICCSFWENCKNSPKTDLGCSTPLNVYIFVFSICQVEYLRLRQYSCLFSMFFCAEVHPVRRQKSRHVYNVGITNNGVTPMGSGWANPRAPGLRGHPHSSIPAKITQKGALGALSNTFFIVWLQNFHNDAFHKLMKSEWLGCPYH